MQFHFILNFAVIIKLSSYIGNYLHLVNWSSLCVLVAYQLFLILFANYSKYDYLPILLSINCSSYKINL